jgi:multiple sugar transport system ATP-binding protein
VPARLVRRAQELAVAFPSGEVFPLPRSRTLAIEINGETSVLFGIRPQHLSRAPNGELPEGVLRLTTSADLIQPTGTRTYVTTRIGGAPVTAELGAHDVHEAGVAIELAVDLNRCILIDAQTDRVISNG